jgi:hypothetical protein
MIVFPLKISLPAKIFPSKTLHLPQLTVSMYELQKLLTHSSPQMTQRYVYLHDDAFRKASGVAGMLFSQVRDGEDLAGEQSQEEEIQAKVRLGNQDNPKACQGYPQCAAGNQGVFCKKYKQNARFLS